MVLCTKFVESMDNFVHTLTKLSTLSGQYEHCSRILLTILLTYTVHAYCLPLLFKCGQFCLHFLQIVHTFWGRMYCSYKTLFTHLPESVDKIVHTFIKLSTLLSEKVHCSRKTLFTHLPESVDKIVHTFIKLSTLLSERVHCSRKTLFTYLTESVDKFVHTFIKLSTLSGDDFYCSRLKCSYG
jgi:hypothetical protein